MKQLISLLVLLASINGTLTAQDNRTATEKLFDYESSQAHKRFWIDLGQGNKMRIEIAADEDLHLFNNMDSVIRTFLHDIEPLKDSLENEYVSKRIDYTTDSAGRRKIRLKLYDSKPSTFLVQNDDVAALKLEQDTINFVGTIYFIAKYDFRKAFSTSRDYRISFFLNDIYDIDLYDDGSLSKKVQLIEQNLAEATGRRDWNTTRRKGTAILKADPDITALAPKGNLNAGDYLTFRFSVDLQNYKNYFVPSVSLGVGVILSTSHFKRDIVLSWDPNFLFDHDADGKLKTHRNDFVTLTAGQGGIRDNDPTKESHLLTILSLGYLVKRDGEFYEKNTFRLGAGRLSLFEGKTKIEPAIYFDHFFKGVTPAVRLIQSF
ncbi:MAG TPA: hypothetical protein VLC28_03255 [Flavitalea sp.]|nr:hypothetical protein [Flavitalea sp.]